MGCHYSFAVFFHDGRDGTAPDPLERAAGAHPKRRRLVSCGSGLGFFAWAAWSLGFGMGNIPASAVSADDVALWPHSPGLLVKWVSFLGSLHCPAECLDLGVGGISYVELFILEELWAGERLSLERAVPRYLRPGRPISVSAVSFGPGIDIWRSCRFIGAMMNEVSFFTWWSWTVCALLCWC